MADSHARVDQQGARASERRAEAEVDVSDSSRVGGRAPVPKSSPRRPCRPRRATWTKCHTGTVFVKDRGTLLFKKKLGPLKTSMWRCGGRSIQEPGHRGDSSTATEISMSERPNLPHIHYNMVTGS